jgi:hypothetical protein
MLLLLLGPARKLTLSCPQGTKYFGKKNEIFLPATYYKIPFIADICGTMLS